jgi:polysaccharide deacetylase family protein (PEP-CTERM system associated)
VTVSAPRGRSAQRRTFVLTIDFEDWHQLVLRRIGRPDWRAGSEEFGSYLLKLLDLLDDADVRATFFVVGVTAERHPHALREVAARGHELACHGYEHRRAFQQTPVEFRADVLRGADVVERLGGTAPAGYRAPWFSITRDSVWAYDILCELGFRYDSSLYDSPFVPRRIRPMPSTPFQVAGGLVEFPLAVWRAAGAGVPIGGGAYWRVLPGAALWHGLEAVARRSAAPVLYFHPYEFADEALRIALPARATRRQRLRETSRRLYKNARRHLIAERLREAAVRFRLVPFRDVLDTRSA